MIKLLLIIFQIPSLSILLSRFCHEMYSIIRDDRGTTRPHAGRADMFGEDQMLQRLGKSPHQAQRPALY